jgi:outer membrane protein assembly factor BamD (BamD/ComL family)
VFDAPSPVDVPQAAPSAPATFKSMEAQQAMEADTPAGDVPPATVASPEVRDAWLARIRALVAAGQVDEARMSLHEFQRRYPAYVLPDDLRALAP